MGKSGSRKKKGASSHASSAVNSTPIANGGVDLDSSIFLKRAHELKEEGNKRFQNKDYVGALELYESALRLTPKTHPDRAVFHSNRAACLMQMKPIDYDTVISECTMALQVQPRFVRALLRRARAYEAIGKYELAMQDVQVLLLADPNHRDALDIAQRLRAAVGPRQEAQQDLQSRPSPAALGASAVGAPIAGLGPCLPTRPVQKKAAASIGGATVLLNSKLEKHQGVIPMENGPAEPKLQFPKVVLKPSSGPAKAPNVSEDKLKEDSLSSLSSHAQSLNQEPKVQLRSLKLVYDHDIRLAMMPVNCRFKVLREIVSKRFPSSKFVLIKYKDADDDLVTITCTSELRLAELCADSFVPKDAEVDKPASLGMLRLHVVEVSPEQEPPLLEEEDEKPVESEESKGDDSGHVSPLGESMAEATDSENDKIEKEVLKEKVGDTEDPECKEVEMDDWLFEFAQLFRTHVGIDPDAHVDLHELGMELCSEALEETVSSRRHFLLSRQGRTLHPNSESYSMDLLNKFSARNKDPEKSPSLPVSWIEVSDSVSRRCQFQPDGHLSVKIIDDSRPAIQRIVDSFLNTFFPSGYPYSVSEGYLRYTQFRALQHVTSAALSVLSTQSLLFAAGLRPTAAQATVVSWVLKDGMQHVGKLICSNLGARMDSEPKRWRVIADVLYDLGAGLEVISPLCPHLFLEMAGLGNFAKGMAVVAARATRLPIYSSFAKEGNLSDLFAKGEAISTLFNVVGIGAGLQLASTICSSIQGKLVAAPLLSIVHVYCVVEQMRATPINTLNPQRTAMIVADFVKAGRIPSPADIRYQEDLVFPGRLIEEAGNVKVGRALHEVIKPSKLVEMKQIFPGEKFVLNQSKKWVDMVLEHDASGEDALRGWLVAAYTTNIKEPSHEPTASVLLEAYEKMNDVFTPFLSELQAKGWYTDRFLDGAGSRFAW